MDSLNIKADSGTAEYYLSRLIQRAIVEPKPLLKIYEEECQRHPDISVTVSFKEFQSSLQRHCMTLQTRHPYATTSQLKQQEMSRTNKEHNSRFTSLSDFVDQRRVRRRPDLQNQAYQRVSQSVLETCNQQGSNMNNMYPRSGPQQPTATAVNIKSEELNTHTPPSSNLPPQQQAASRPPSVQLPVEEEPPPEFIEMSSNTPLMTSTCQYSGMSMYQSQVSGEESIPHASGSVACKTEPKESDSGSIVVSAVQSSSPLDKNALLSADDISPLNVRCVKCISALVTCAVMPCGHCCLCNICGQTAVSLKQVCPVCRKSITTVIGYSNLIFNVYR